MSERKEYYTIFNIHINDSIIQRSNILSFCNLDGIFGRNIVIDDSVIRRSDITGLHRERIENEKQRQKEEERFKKKKEKDDKEDRIVIYGAIILMSFIAPFLILLIPLDQYLERNKNVQ